MAEDDLVDKRAEEAESVAVDLDQRGDDGAQGDAEAAGLDESVDEEQHQVKGGQEQPPRRQHDGAHEDADAAEDEHGGERVDGLQRVGVELEEVDARLTEDVHLAEELAEVAAALMVDVGVAVEAGGEAGLMDAEAEVDVLAIHVFEAAHALVHLTRKAHVEGAGLELLQVGAAAAYAARGPEGGHGVADGLLRGGEAGVLAVGAAEAVGRLGGEVAADGGEVVRRDDAVGVEEDEIRTVGGTHPDVARVAAAGVGLDDVVDREAGAEGFHLGRAGPGGAILDEYQFKVPIGLHGEAFEQFAGLVRAIVDGDDDGEEGRRVHFTSLSSWIRRGHFPQRSITQRT